MDRKSQETPFPANADCTKPELAPVVRKVRGMREGKPRAASSIVRETYLHPTDVPVKLPCKGEM